MHHQKTMLFRFARNSTKIRTIGTTEIRERQSSDNLKRIVKHALNRFNLDTENVTSPPDPIKEQTSSHNPRHIMSLLANYDLKPHLSKSASVLGERKNHKTRIVCPYRDRISFTRNTGVSGAQFFCTIFHINSSSGYFSIGYFRRR
jgi:hypothetical protein